MQDSARKWLPLHYDLIKDLFMTQEYARVSVEMPEKENKKSTRQELTYEIENNDIQEEYTIKL